MLQLGILQPVISLAVTDVTDGSTYLREPVSETTQGYTLGMAKSTSKGSGDLPIEVGVKELRADISRWIEFAQHHDVVITNRGMPVARLVAVDEYPALERLIERGLVRLPARPARALDVGDLVQARGSVSDLVAEQRG
jgi:prevent-host-death family protein